MKAILFLIALLVLSLVVVRILLQLDFERFLIPAPDQVVEEFLSALETKRFEPALQYLTDDLRQRTSLEELREEKQRFEDKYGDFQRVSTETLSEQKEVAEVQVTVKTSRGQQASFAMPLRKERGEWRISSLDALKQKASLHGFAN